MSKFLRRSPLLLLILLFAIQAPAATYDIDKGHSSIGFKIRHMVVSKVAGSFGEFEGSFEFEEGKPDAWSIKASIDAGSIDTASEKRDQHLLGSDFLDAEKFPTLEFSSKRVEKSGDDYVIIGDFTLHGVTKELKLDLEYHGSIQDPWGNQRAGFTATTTLNRQDYGLSWSKALESGGLVVGDEVEVTLEIEGILRK
jgi:polyisoprenoid-binding protein YceI